MGASDDLHRRARRGIRVLLGRHAVRQLLAFAGGVVVARELGPGPIGVYGIGLFVLSVCALVADFGLRSSLIRQATAPSQRELEVCFGFQLIIATVLMLAMLLSAPRLTLLYPGAPAELTWVIRILALDLWLQPWRAVSEVRLERELRYGHFAAADIAGTAANQLVAVSLVLTGAGARSLAWALLAGSLLRTLLIFRASPWSVRPRLDAQTLRGLLTGALPIQANQLITLAPAWVTPTLVAVIIGPEAVGILSWAAGLGRKPLELLENVVRVSGPHLARLQADLHEVERVLSRYLHASLLVCGLWFVTLAIAGRELVTFVYTERWLPAVPALLIFAGSAVIGAVRWLAAGALISIGRASLTAMVSTVGAIVAMTASVLLVMAIGLTGVPLGQLAALLLVTPWLLSRLRPGLQHSAIRHAVPVLAPMSLAAAAGALTMLLPLGGSARGVLAAVVMLLAFSAVAWWQAPAWLRSGMRETLELPVRRADAAQRRLRF